jgi:MFS family permease
MSSTLAYRIGAWSWIVCGVGHTVLDVAMRLSPKPDEERVDAALRAHVFELGGIQRTSYEVMQGISLAMGVAIVTVGVLLLFVGRLASSSDRTRPAILIGLVTSVVMLGLSVALLPSPPIVLLTVASVSFGIALLRGEPTATPR